MLSPQRSTQYSYVQDLRAHKLVRAEAQLGVERPDITSDKGHWLTMPASQSAGCQDDKWSHGNWFGGFWGRVTDACINGGDERFLDWATERMKLVAPHHARLSAARICHRGGRSRMFVDDGRRRSTRWLIWHGSTRLQRRTMPVSPLRCASTRGYHRRCDDPQ